MRSRSFVLLLCLAFMPVTSSQALDGFVFGGGAGTTGSQVSRAGVLQATGIRWLESGAGHAEVYIEAALHYWNDGGNNITGISVVPAVIYQFNTGNPNLRPVIEYGIGGTLNNHTRIGGRELGTSFQFENRIGLGVLMGQHHRLILRFSHTSNAGIGGENEGFDAVTLNYQYLW